MLPEPRYSGRAIGEEVECGSGHLREQLEEGWRRICQEGHVQTGSRKGRIEATGHSLRKGPPGWSRKQRHGCAAWEACDTESCAAS